jgi:hypothetical protein
VAFARLTEDDVTSIAQQLCEVKLSADVCAFIHGTANRFRQVIMWLYRAEARARANNKKEISIADLKG